MDEDAASAWNLGGAALGAGVIGRRPLPLGEEAAPYGTVDVSARVGWRFVELRFAVRNLLDAQTRPVELHYESRLDPDDPFGSLRAARHFAAGPPRGRRRAPSPSCRRGST